MSNGFKRLDCLQMLLFGDFVYFEICSLKHCIHVPFSLAYVQFWAITTYKTYTSDMYHKSPNIMVDDAAR